MGLPTSLIRDVKGTSAADWAAESGLNWTAEKVPLQYFPEDGVSRTSSKVAIVRSDTGQELGVVSPQYQIVQPSDILSGFEEAVHNLGAGFRMDGIGLYDDGRLIWGRASSDVSLRIKGQDAINTYLYMITSFDGSVSTMGFVSTLRVACSNAFHLASNKGDKLFALSHRSKYRGQAKNALDTYMQQVNGFEADANRLANTTLEADAVVEYYKKLLYPSKTDIEQYSEREKSVLVKYIDAALKSPGSEFISAKQDGHLTAWGVLNGVTYVVDNDPVRRTATSAKSSFIGAGDALKKKAWNHAMKLAA